MMNVKERMELTKNWCKAHGFPYKVMGNIIYWQTKIQTAEADEERKTLVWHDRKYFDTIAPRLA